MENIIHNLPRDATPATLCSEDCTGRYRRYPHGQYSPFPISPESARATRNLLQTAVSGVYPGLAFLLHTIAATNEMVAPRWLHAGPQGRRVPGAGNRVRLKCSLEIFLRRAGYVFDVRAAAPLLKLDFLLALSMLRLLIVAFPMMLESPVVPEVHAVSSCGSCLCL